MSATLTFQADYLERLGEDLFTACGAPREEARIVAHELVEASLRGLESHGVTRYVMYTQDALAGKIKVGVPIRIVKETPTSAVVDCGLNFGPVTASRMADIVCDKAALSGLAAVVSQHSYHVSRLGSYVEKIASKGMIGLATCNSFKGGHWVVPWGGREGRLATNPLAFAAPTSGDPLVLDMSTSMIAEGKIRALMNEGKNVPAGCIQDAQGNPATDPKAFYGPPRGTILPFGSELGYKGFGLSLMVEILGSTLAGVAIKDEFEYMNGLFLLAISPSAFGPQDLFVKLMDELCAYQKSAAPAPGSRGVVLPGELDFALRAKRLKEGIPLPQETWKQIQEVAVQAGLTIHHP